MEIKKRCISCGKINKRYFFLVLGVIITLIIYLVVIFEFQKNAKKINLDIDNLTFLNILSYTFFLNIGESLMIIPHFILKKRSSLKNIEINTRHSTNLSIKYIFNRKSIDFSLKEKINFYSVGLLKLFLYIIFIAYQLYIEIDFKLIKFFTYYFQFELLFIFLSSKIMYNIQFYRHQYLSIFILTISGFINFLIKNYDNKIGKFFFSLFSHILYSFLKAFITVYIKGLMEYKYISPYKACYIYGIINLIIITIAYIITSFFPCNYNEETCDVLYNGKYYFAHILAIIDISGLFMFIVLLLKAILLVLNYIIIFNFSVFHSFLIIQLPQIIEADIFENLFENYFRAIFILIFTFINVFFILLFLEIIEINVCKISYNTRKNIENRTKLDNIDYSITNIEETFEEEEIQEENSTNRKDSL